MTAPIDPLLPPYPGIRLDDVHLVQTLGQAGIAVEALLAGDAVGFDTESKPTFAKGEVSTGPHLIQLATDRSVYLFPVHANPALGALREVLESPRVLKAGFGLREDVRRLESKLGIRAEGIVDLARLLREGRCDMGAKTAVARFFGQRLQKSKKTSTSNWANPRLTERQMLYAADDAHVALKVYRAWRLAGGTLPQPD